MNNTYDDSGRTTKNYIDGSASLVYTYTKGNLSSVRRTGAVAGAQQYNFYYDAFGNSTAILVGEHTLAEYVYAAGNGNLTQQIYGNGDTVSYTYDYLGRIQSATYSNGRELTYTYNGEGQLHSMTDSATGNTDTYTYDSLGRLLGTKQTVNNNRTAVPMMTTTGLFPGATWCLGSVR